MAILQNNKYHKISACRFDFINNTKEIEITVYSNKETRDREKLLSTDIENLKQKIHQLLYVNMQNLISKTNAITPIDTINDKETFLNEHLDLKEESILIDEIQQEGIKLINDLGINIIELNSLKHLDKWKELGFKEDMINPITPESIAKITFGNDNKLDLPDLYNNIKTIMEDTEDC